MRGAFQDTLQRHLNGGSATALLRVARHQLDGVVDAQTDEHRDPGEHRWGDRRPGQQRDADGEDGGGHRGDQRPHATAHAERAGEQEQHHEQRNREEDGEQLRHRAHDAETEQRRTGDDVCELRIVIPGGAGTVLICGCAAALGGAQLADRLQRVARCRRQRPRVCVVCDAMGQLAVDLVLERGHRRLIADELGLQAHRDDGVRCGGVARLRQHGGPLRFRCAVPVAAQRWAVGQVEQRPLEEDLTAGRDLEQ